MRAFSESILTYFFLWNFISVWLIILFLIIVIVVRIGWLFLSRIVFDSFALCLSLIVIVSRSLIVVDARSGRMILIVIAFELAFLQTRSVCAHTQLGVEYKSFWACFQIGHAVWAVPKLVTVCLMIKVAEKLGTFEFLCWHYSHWSRSRRCWWLVRWSCYRLVTSSRCCYRSIRRCYRRIKLTRVLWIKIWVIIKWFRVLKLITGLKLTQVNSSGWK